MANVNKQILIGRLTQDPDLRTTPKGNPVCGFTVAVNEKAGPEREHTEFFSVVAWGQLGITCSNHLKKGSLVYVEGPTRTRKWTDAQGVARSRPEVIASQVDFLQRSSTSEPVKRS